MHNIKLHQKNKGYWLITIFMGLFLILANNNSNSTIQISVAFDFCMYIFSFYVLIYSFFRLLEDKKINIYILKVSILFIMLFTLYMISTAFLSTGITSTGRIRSMQIVVIFFTILSFYYHGANGMARSLIIAQRNLAKLLISVFLLYSFIFGVYSNYSGGLSNANGFGMWVFIFAITLFISTGEDRKKALTYIYFFACFYLIFISSSRTSLLAISVSTIVFLMAPNSARFRRIYPFIIFVGVVIFSIGVLAFTLSHDLSAYNQMTMEITGKNLASGRQVVWPIVIDSISSNLLLGMGASAGLSDFSDFTFSAHNLFIQTALQTGLIGLTFLILIIFFTFRLISLSFNSKLYKASISAFAGILIMQSFEVTLTQNNLSLSLPIWALLGLAYGDAAHERLTSLNSRGSSQ